MNTSSLQAFATKITAKKRITFGDVRRLQRDILPDGIGSREEAELLLSLDGAVERADGAWCDWLVGAIVDFVVWGERPTGLVESDAAQWLTDRLTASGQPSKAGRRIAREIRCEAERVAEPMVSFAAEDEAEAPAGAASVPAPVEARPAIA
jgi:hypothetical protein